VVGVARIVNELSVPAHFSDERREAFERGKRSPAFPAGAAIVDEARFKNRLEDIDERMVDNAVTEVAHAYLARFRIAQNKGFKRSWLVRSGFESSMKRGG
jgi:hypothetical protein